MHDPGVCGDCWFLRRVLRSFVSEFRDVIIVGEPILKAKLYQSLSWWFRLGRDDAREVLRLLVQAFPGVAYSNRGLKIPKTYLPQGGEPSGVGA